MSDYITTDNFISYMYNSDKIINYIFSNFIIILFKLL